MVYGNFEAIVAILDSKPNTEADWNTFPYVIPENMIIITSDTKIIKQGDGISLFSELATLDSISVIQQDLEQLPVYTMIPALVDEDKIIVIEGLMYKIKNTTITSLLTRVQSIITKNGIQNNTMDSIDLIISLITKPVAITDDEKFAYIVNGQLVPGNTLTELEEAVSGGELIGAEFLIGNLTWYSDVECKYPVIELIRNNFYYAKIDAFHDGGYLNYSATLTSVTPGVNIVSVDDKHIFKVSFSSGTIVLNAAFVYTITSNSNNAVKSFTAQIDESRINILTMESFTSGFKKIAIDSDDNIFVIGSDIVTQDYSITADPRGDKQKSTITKFDKNLKAVKTISITSQQHPDIATYSVNVCEVSSIKIHNNLIYVSGVVNRQDTEYNCGFLAYFDNDLNLLKRIDIISDSSFFESMNAFITDFVIDNNYIYFCGSLGIHELTGNYNRRSIVGKIDNKLEGDISSVRLLMTISSPEYNMPSRFNSICLNQGYLYVAGIGESIADGDQGVIAKLDTNLNIINRKYITTTNDASEFKKVIVANGKVYIVGYVWNTSGETIVGGIITSLSLDLETHDSITLDYMANCFLDDIIYDSVSNNLKVLGTAYKHPESPIRQIMIFNINTDLTTISSKNFLWSKDDHDINGKSINMDSLGNLIFSGYKSIEVIDQFSELNPSDTKYKNIIMKINKTANISPAYYLSTTAGDDCQFGFGEANPDYGTPISGYFILDELISALVDISNDRMEVGGVIIEFINPALRLKEETIPCISYKIYY